MTMLEGACDVCGVNPPVGVASSVLGAISWAYCRTCLERHADVEVMFAVTYDTCGDRVGEWLSEMSTWKDGRYWTWEEWLAWRKTQPPTEYPDTTPPAAAARAFEEWPV